MRTRLKNLKTGKMQEVNFKSAETLTFEDVQYKKMQYLYNDGTFYTFMDHLTYEQVSLTAKEIEDSILYLKEGIDVNIVMHHDQPISLSLPQKIEYTIVYTEPAVKGDTASGNVLKEAELDNGLKVRVPMFLSQGDRILVNTEDGSYGERVN